MKVYTEEEVSKIYKAFREFCKKEDIATCNLVYPEINGIEVSIVAFKHSDEKIVLEVTEKHFNDIKI